MKNEFFLSCSKVIQTKLGKNFLSRMRSRLPKIDCVYFTFDGGLFTYIFDRGGGGG